ncbi:MAG: tRNA preQ1(34) S-adenosylmethionine ribosyltransferase-isomerase QueA [Patescibacteria group bacterium]
MKWSDVEGYDYVLPKELIRRTGVEPRDEARLFVYDTKSNTVTLDIFQNLVEYLPANSLMVLNDTRVLPARLWLRKVTGGKIEVFVLMNQFEDEARIPVLVDRKVVIGQKLFFPNGEAFEVIDQEEGIFFVKVLGVASLHELLATYGETPVPHYLEDTEAKESELRTRYQTIFAKSDTPNRASVAAPTASLHFTERVFESLKQKDIRQTRLTLDVGLGTFAPLTETAFENKKLHKEYVEVSKDTAHDINTAKQENRAVIAVGTTVTRTVEALTKTGEIQAYSGSVDIFIYPPYQFQTVDILLTNFHLPKTSLMLLVDAFLQHKESKRDILSLYEEAIRNDFAFYSFGDSMLIK